MPDRKQVGKRLRFEIFKRDVFTCQYCGDHPPSAILHVDHIIAIAEGGTSDPDNLITSCAACNLGKGAKSLDSIPQSLSDRALEVREREEQIRGYESVMSERRARLDAIATEAAEIFERMNPGWTVNERGLISIRQFADKIGRQKVLDAMELACVRISDQTQIYRYFCGICWRTIRGEQ